MDFSSVHQYNEIIFLRKRLMKNENVSLSNPKDFILICSNLFFFWIVHAKINVFSPIWWYSLKLSSTDLIIWFLFLSCEKLISFTFHAHFQLLNRLKLIEKNECWWLIYSIFKSFKWIFYFSFRLITIIYNYDMISLLSISHICIIIIITIKYF